MIAAAPDISVALVDVVMDGDDAGLRVIDHVRNVLRNRLIRLILRTGQPGSAPEKEVLIRYEINDYKTKSELSATKLFSVLISALRNYQDLLSLEQARRGLDRTLEATSAMFRARTLDRLMEIALGKLTSLLDLEHQVLESGTAEGCVVRETPQGWMCMAVVGKASRYAPLTILSDEIAQSRDVITIQLNVDENSGRYAIWFRPGRAINSLDVTLIQLFKLNAQTALQHLLSLAHVANAQHMAVMAIAQLAGTPPALSLDFGAQLGKPHQVSAEKSDFLLILAVQAEVPQWGDVDRARAHLLRVRKLSMQIAEKLGLGTQFCEDLGYAAQFHDLGNAFVPSYKVGNWYVPQQPERDEAIKHTLSGRDYLLNLRATHPRRMELAAKIALSHHEAWNGSGFPQGQSGEAIPLAARIVAVADFWDTYTHTNVFMDRDAASSFEVMELISLGSGAYFDPRVVRALRAILKSDAPPDFLAND